MLSEDHCRRMLIKAVQVQIQQRAAGGGSAPGSEQVPGGLGGPVPPGQVLTAFPGRLQARVRSS